MEGEDGHHDPSLGPVDPNGKDCGCIFLIILYAILLPIIANPELWGEPEFGGFPQKPISTLIAFGLTGAGLYLAIKIIRT